MARKQTEAMSYGIIGLGRFGSALAATLAEADKELMVLDRSEEKIRQARNYTEHAYVVKDLQKETLRETGIQNCDVVVVCIGDKVDVSILTTLNVINLGVPQVVAKANSPEQGEILEKIGAQVVYPERDMAVRLARRLISKRIFNLFELDQNVDISEIKTTRKLTGQSVRDAAAEEPVRHQHNRHHQRRMADHRCKPGLCVPGRGYGDCDWGAGRRSSAWQTIWRGDRGWEAWGKVF